MLEETLNRCGMAGMLLLLVALPWAGAQNAGPGLPATEGETLSGKSIRLSESTAGHASVLVMGFSKDSSDPCADWGRTLRNDPALGGVRVWGAAMLAGAPGFVRGVIKSGMRKGLSTAEQDGFVVLVKDEALWRGYFGVGNDKDPYVVLLDAQGKVRWRGHGLAKDMEMNLQAALKGATDQTNGHR